MLCGITFGLIGYTYFASLFWIAFYGLIIVGLAVFSYKHRRYALLSLVIALVLVIPMGMYIFRNQDVFLNRPGGVSISLGELRHHLQMWTGVWFQQGDVNQQFNLSGRSVLDTLTGILVGLGLIKVLVFSKRRWLSVLLLVWGILACLPSLMSNLAPHFLRSFGVSVTVGLLMGGGVHMVADTLQRIPKAGKLAPLAAVLYIPIALSTYQDFHVAWVHHPDTFMSMEMYINKSANLIEETEPDDNFAYFSPFTPAHPVIGL